MRYSTTLAFLCATIPALAQNAFTRIAPDEAGSHLIQAPPARYPPLAEAGRIQGNVILEITIDESGRSSARRLVAGHPLLIAAAVASVSDWRYRPFDAEGKPISAVTIVMVTFGDAANHRAEDNAEMLFQHEFWTAAEAAISALTRKDFRNSEDELKKARTLFPPPQPRFRHTLERWQWMTTMGKLRFAQNKYDEAEQSFRNALELYERSEDKDSPEAASSLADLGSLYAAETSRPSAQSHDEVPNNL